MSEAPRIVSPQNVDLDYDKYNSTRGNKQNVDNGHGFSNKSKVSRYDNIESSQLKNSPGIDTNSKMGTGNFSEQSGKAGAANRNGNYGSRPATSGEAMGSSNRNGMSRSIGTKSKSNFPAVRGGTIINPLSADPEELNDKLKEDREAVEDLERWDSEYKLVASMCISKRFILIMN